MGASIVWGKVFGFREGGHRKCERCTCSSQTHGDKVMHIRSLCAGALSRAAISRDAATDYPLEDGRKIAFCG